MLTILSPSKTIKFSPPLVAVASSQPRFLSDASKLVRILKSMDPDEISNLMRISPNLARLTFERYQQWHSPFNNANATQSMFTFKGDVFEGLDANSFSKEEVMFAQATVCILSGLYGILRPLDLMQPYRLEMGARLAVDNATNLYEFWGDKLAKSLEEELVSHATPVLVNLASQEYFKSVASIEKRLRVITPNFYETTSGIPRIVAIHAKRARGLMVRFIVKQRIDDPEQLKFFEEEGYVFSQNVSKGDAWAFIR